jgi:hypothetical protein
VIDAWDPAAAFCWRRVWSRQGELEQALAEATSLPEVKQVRDWQRRETV